MTNEERAWMDWIVRQGCAICRAPAQVHHLKSGGRRIGHLHTIPLCFNHHESHRDDDQITSLHHWKKRWERRYDTTETEILANLRRLYASRNR